MLFNRLKKVGLLSIFLLCTVSVMAKPVTPRKFYIFVSFSMPKAILAHYVAESVRFHGIVVLRGSLPDQTFSEFIHKKLAPLLRKTPRARVWIDPNLFEQFDVHVVPTFVLAPSSLPCIRQGDHCEPTHERYYKVAGNINITEVLAQFRKAKAPKAWLKNVGSEDE